MTENQMADTPFEGQNPFEEEEGDGTSTGSPTENNEEDENGDSGADDKNQKDPHKDVPFHDHPRWKQREEEWQNRFNTQEKRHQDDIKSVREEFVSARKDNRENDQIPAWFGGSQEQWNAYRTDRDSELKLAEERAYERVNAAKTAETKAIEQATAYMQSEVAFIENDKTINSQGMKIDPNKLLKIVMDNDLVDSQGRWNYRAGWRMLQSQGNPSASKPGDRKTIAGATTSDSKGETKPQPFKTTADFKKNRPW